MFLSRDDAEAAARRALALSRAESCRVYLNGWQSHNVRLASRGGMSNGSAGAVRINVTSSFGKRVGRASASALDDASLRDVVARSELAAQRAPENPEAMPPLGPQQYSPSDAYFEDTARLSTADLVDRVAPAAGSLREAGLDFALFTHAGRAWSAVATSAGAVGYDRETGTGLSITARNARGTWSGWGGRNVTDARQLDVDTIARAAIDKAQARPDPVQLDPGKYVALLEPSVVGDMLAHLMWRFDTRAADEGRSFLSRQSSNGVGGNKLGERLFDERITITSDPADKLAPGFAFDREGLPRRPTAWVENGVVRTLSRGRYWAQKTGQESVAFADYFTLRGGNDSVDSMIRDVRHGVLVTRLWYVRTVDPRTVLLTGLTRDGTFLIENGRVTRPITNFRFNESPLAVFANVLGIGPAQRCRMAEIDETLAVPPLLVKDFTFSSISPAV
jgi:predicted Zn-dependent protease